MMSEYPQRQRLEEMLIQMETPVLPQRALSELLYTAQETHLIDEESPLEKPVTLFKLFQLAMTITESELKEIRM